MLSEIKKKNVLTRANKWPIFSRVNYLSIYLLRHEFVIYRYTFCSYNAAFIGNYSKPEVLLNGNIFLELRVDFYIIRAALLY